MHILILIAALIGFGGGFFVASKIGAENLMQCERGKQKMLEEQAQESVDRMQAAAQSTDKAMTYAMTRIIGAEQQAEKLKNELKNHATGRDCLSADALRVLQPASAAKQRMPKGAGSADSAAAGSAGNPGHGDETTASTDADIAGWIADAYRLYEQCRARIDAIGQWDAGLNGRN